MFLVLCCTPVVDMEATAFNDYVNSYRYVWVCVYNCLFSSNIVQIRESFASNVIKLLM